MKAPELITEHLHLWTGAITTKSTAGRGRNGKIELTGIKKLRELILELAVRGRLVDQDPNDEPASVLLERIAKKKARLVNKGKIKKPKELPQITEAEVRFPLPSGWAWFRIGSYLELEYGKALATKDRHESGSVDVYGSNGIVGKHDEQLVSDPCIIIGRKGSAGALNKTFRPSWTTDVAYYLVPPEGFDLDYCYLLLLSLRLDELGKGIKPGLNRNEAYSLVAALPPLNEQYRIVEKVDELMALCDRLEQQVGDQLEAHEVLVDTLLDALTRATEADEVATHWARIAEHFDTLFTTESSIDKLKQTILQLAIRGRLVPQDPNEESAQSLLARLRCERQRWLDTHKEENPECKTMLRKLNSLDAPPPPFPLPKGWEVAHLIQLSKFLVDCHNKTAPYADDGIPIIRTSNIKERRFVLDELKYVNEETYRYWSRRCPPEPKDIIFTREAPMGEAAIIPQGARWCLGQRTMLIRPMLDHVQEEYLLLALTDPQLLESASEKAIGSTVKHLRVGDVEQLPIPVPPLEEQRRIVEKTDELMAVCDQLKARLGEASETRTRLAETVVEQAVN